MGRKVSPTLIGAFVVGGLALAVVGVAVFGSGRLFRDTQEFVLYFDRSVNGLRVGAPVKFKGVEVGAVARIELSLSHRLRRPGEVHIPVVIEVDAERLTERGARVELTPAWLAGAIQEGLRGQLATESFVTGVLYLELDYHPGSPVTLEQEPEVHIPEIPTLPTALEQVQTKASEIIAKLGQVDFQRLGQSLTEAVDGVNQLVNSPDVKKAVAALDEAVQNLEEGAAAVRLLATDVRASVGPLGKSLQATSAEAEAALADVRSLVEPGAPLRYQLSDTLTQLAEAARALRALAETLERDPSAIVRGKPIPRDDP